MSFGSFLGMGGDEHAYPWRKLTYDIRLDGYQTDISESQVQSARAALLTCTETGTGRIGTKSENCTITIVRHITWDE